MKTPRPRTILIAGWVLFVLGCYPGYLSFDSTMRFYAVRSGVFTDDAPVVTGIWSLLEYVMAGPFPMLALQSGLFLFGLYGVLRRFISAPVAAITAALVLLFPPVFAPMSCIWPDSLMAGALLAAAAALVEPSQRWKIGGGVLLVVACACRMQIVLALAPIVFVGLPELPRWRRAGAAIAATVLVAIIAAAASWALVDDDHHAWRQDVMVTDIVGTMRRAHVADPSVLAGLTVRSDAHARLASQHDAFDPWPLMHGDTRLVEPLADDEQAAALFEDWRHVVAAHPSAYLLHRWAIARRLLGFSGRSPAVLDSFGETELIGPLHHRASPSDWEIGMQAIVDVFDATPLFRPWLYIPLAVLALYLARRHRLLRNLAICGVTYEIVQFFAAPGTDYRFSHWFVTATTVVLTASLVARKWPAQSVSNSAT